VDRSYDPVLIETNLIAILPPLPRQCRMPDWLTHGALIAGRVLAGLVGCVCFYLAFFLYEDEEGEIENKLQDKLDGLWIRVHDRARITGSTAAALLNKVGEASLRLIDRLFEHPISPIKLIAISSNISIGGFFLSLAYREYVDTLGPATPHYLRNTMTEIIMAVCFFSLAALSGKKSRLWALIALIPAAILSTFLIYVWTVQSLVFGFSLLVDYVALIIIRRLFSGIASSSSLIKIILIMGTLLVFAILVTFGPLRLWRATYGLTAFAWLILGFEIASLNLTTALFCSVPVIFLAGILLHWCLWPIISRVIYPLSRHKIVTNRKVLLSIGTLCLIFAFRLEHVGAKELLKLFS